MILSSVVWPLQAEALRSQALEYGQLSRQRLMAGAFLSANDYVLAQQRRRGMIAAVDAFRHVDVLLTASALVPPCRIDDPSQLAATHQLQAWTPFSDTGHPAVSVMTALSRAGLPLSMQLVGPALRDSLVLEAAAAYERCTDWHSFRSSAITTCGSKL